MDAAMHTRRPATPFRSPPRAAACIPVEEALASLGSGRVLIELGKWLFYRFPRPSAHRRPHPGGRHMRRRAAYFDTADAARRRLP